MSILSAAGGSQFSPPQADINSLRRGGEARWLSVVEAQLSILHYKLSIISAAGGYQFTQL